jgi:ADP-heptose:LPS heptosyltransferase
VGWRSTNFVFLPQQCNERKVFFNHEGAQSFYKIMKKILLLRFSSIGDIVLTSPVVRCLRKRYPEAEIHFLCKTKFTTLLKANPYINKVYGFDKDFDTILPQLKAEGYDVVIDLHKNLRSLRLRKFLGITTYAFNKTNWAKWLMVNFKINQLPEEHIVHRYMATVKPLGVVYDGEGLDYFIPEDQTFDRTKFGIRPDEPFLAFAIGAAHATKRLPLEKIKAICALLPQKVVLLGGPAEQSVGATVINSQPKVINSCGKLSLHQSADAIRQASLVITHDTGMMHIAAAFRKKILSVWGNTIPEFGMFPFYPEKKSNRGKPVLLDKMIEVKGLSCRPCSKIGFDQCPKGHFKCMEEIDIEEIKRAVGELEG